LPRPLEQASLLLLALLEEFAVGLNWLAPIKECLVQGCEAGRRNRGGRSVVGRRSGGRGGRALGLGEKVEPALR
jgi:hypothetical protein